MYINVTYDLFINKSKIKNFLFGEFWNMKQMNFNFFTTNTLMSLEYKNKNQSCMIQRRKLLKKNKIKKSLILLK